MTSSQSETPSGSSDVAESLWKSGLKRSPMEPFCPGFTVTAYFV